MKATHGRKILGGDIANLSIGQGDLLATPLQMAQAMAIVANGGTFYQTRLVEQVQTVGNEIVAAYSVRAKKTIEFSPMIMEQIHTAMVDAVNAPAGTAHQASLDKVSVAGKTGTAQWGPKEKERTAAWFAGFVPAEHPQYAFAALYEGDVGSSVHGGSAAAPMIGRILRSGLQRGRREQKGGRRTRGRLGLTRRILGSAPARGTQVTLDSPQRSSSGGTGFPRVQSPRPVKRRSISPSALSRTPNSLSLDAAAS